MAKVKLKIEVGGTTTATGLNASSDKSPNNIGFSSVPSNYDNSFKGTRLLMVDSLYINQQGLLANGQYEDAGELQSEQNKRQFVYGKTNGNGEYELTLTLTTDTGTFDKIIIIGDTVTNQFPIEALVDGTTTIYSDDANWAIDLGEKQQTHTIKFTKWNKENYNACFNQIKLMLQYYEIDKFNGLKSVESLSQSTPDASSIYYGTLANSGNAELVVIDEEFKDLIVDGVLDNSNVPVELYVNNKLVQAHITTDSDYTQEKILKLQFTNKLENWDKVNYVGYPYPNISKTAYEMLEDVLGTTNGLGYNLSEINNMLSEEIIYGNDNQFGTIKSYLESITIPYPYLPNDTYRNTIEKFCRLAQLQVFQKDNGDIKFVSARPVATQSQIGNSIVIPQYAQIENLNKTIILKNKYNSVEIPEKKVQVVNKSIYSSSSINITKNQYYPVATSDNPDYTLNVTRWGATQEPYASDGTWLYVKYDYDLKNTSEIFYKDVSSFSIKVNQTKTDYMFTHKTNWFSGSDTTKDENSNSIEKVIDNTDKGEPLLPYDNPKLTLTGDILTVEFTVRITAYLDGAVIGDKKWNEFVTTLITFDIMANCLNFEDILIRDNGVNAKTIAIVQGSELLQTNTMYSNSISMATLIKNNIKNDYSQGISSGKINLFCLNFKDENNNNVIDFSNGEILETNQLLSISGENKKWRTTGRKFNYNGQCTTDMEVEEVKTVKTWNECFTYQEITSGGEVTGYKITGMTDLIDENVFVPSNHLGLPVKQISGIYSFDRKDEIVSVSLPNSIERIDNDTFKNCSSLTTINIPDNVTMIRNSVFYGCSGLKQIDLSNITNIQPYAFYNCSSLVNINLSNSLTFIGNEAFYNCNSMSEVIFPSSVTYFGINSFKNCTGLTDVFIHSEMTESRVDFESGANKAPFYGCSSSLKIHIPSSVTPANSYGAVFNYYSMTEQLTYVKDL